MKEQMTDIVERLEASLRFDVVNGDVFERTVLVGQVREAIAAINLLRTKLAEAQKDAAMHDQKIDGLLRELGRANNFHEQLAIKLAVLKDSSK